MRTTLLFLMSFAGCRQSADTIKDTAFSDPETETDTDTDVDADSDADTDADTDTPTEPQPNDTGAAGFAVLINEILADPGPNDANCDGTPDTGDDEFVEIVNSGSVAVDLGGATLADGQSVRHVFRDGTVLQPNDAVVVFGGGAPAFAAAGTPSWCVDLPDTVTVVKASEGSLSLNNGGDTLTLTGAFGAVLASETYGANADDDQSINRSPELEPSAFVRHNEVPGAIADLSPGTLVDGRAFSEAGGATTTPTGSVPTDYSGLVINEIMADPGTAQDSNCDGIAESAKDEYVEIVNTLAQAVDLSNVTLSDAGAVRHTFPVGTVLQAGGTVVVFGGGSPAFPGVGTEAWCLALPVDVVLQVASSGSLVLNNDGDTVTLADPSLSTITSYTYGSEANIDAALVRSPEYTGTALVSHLSVSAWAASPGTRIDGTPHDPFSIPTDTGTMDTGTLGTGTVGPLQLVINEILADPAPNTDPNCDGTANTSDDEFIEIYNLASTAADLSNVTIADSFSTRHTFAAGTVLQPNGAVVVFGGGTPLFDGTSAVAEAWCVDLPDTVLVLAASTGSTGFNNSGDTITLADGSGTVLDTYTYGAEGGNDTSLVRDPELDLLAPYALHNTVSANPWSPGTRADGSSF